MNDAEKDAWITHKDIINIGNTNYPDYKNIVEKILLKLKILGCSKNINLHSLHMHLD